MKFHQMTAEELAQRFGVRFSQGRSADASPHRRKERLPARPSCADSVGVLASCGALLGALLRAQWQWLLIPALFAAEKLFRLAVQKKISSLSAKRGLESPPVSALRDGQRVLLSPEQIVRGDVLFLTEGDRAPVPCRVAATEQLTTRLEDGSLCPKQTAPADSPLINCLQAKEPVVQGAATVLALEAYSALPSSSESSRQKWFALASSAAFVFLFFFTLFLSKDVAEAFFTACAGAFLLCLHETDRLERLPLLRFLNTSAKKGVSFRGEETPLSLVGINVVCADERGIVTRAVPVAVMAYRGRELIAVEPEHRQELTPLLSYARLAGTGEDELDGALGRALDYLDMPEQKLLTSFSGVIPLQKTPAGCCGSRFSLNGEDFMLLRGEPEILLSHCRFLDDGTGRTCALDATALSRIHTAEEQMLEKYLRPIAVAYKKADEGDRKGLQAAELIFYGLVGFYDPPLQNVRESIRIWQQAGVRPLLFSHRSEASAQALARHFELFDEECRLLTGSEILAMDFDRLCAEVMRAPVCCDCSPNAKKRVIEALHKMGQRICLICTCGEDVQMQADCLASLAGISPKGVRRSSHIDTEHGLYGVFEAFVRSRVLVASLRTLHMCLSFFRLSLFCLLPFICSSGLGRCLLAVGLPAMASLFLLSSCARLRRGWFLMRQRTRICPKASVWLAPIPLLHRSLWCCAMALTAGFLFRDLLPFSAVTAVCLCLCGAALPVLLRGSNGLSWLATVTEGLLFLCLCLLLCWLSVFALPTEALLAVSLWKWSLFAVPLLFFSLLEIFANSGKKYF